MLKKIGRYEIRLQIGRGAMGVVYEAWDTQIERRVALKTLRTDRLEALQRPGLLARFLREAKVLARLSHPHIVTIHDYGEDEGTPYLVMEYVVGHELAHDLERNARFPIEDVVRIMTQMLAALAHAHGQGVVHRDLKPTNMFLLQDGSLKVVDFGIAHIEDSEVTMLTSDGTVLGTPAYMSPEQVSALPADHRSDFFSAGIILYELLVGERPFTGASVHTIKQKVRNQEPLRPSEANPTLSPAWDRVLSRALAKNPSSRYESALEFSEAIKSAFQAERSHAEEGRLKTAEATERAHRAATERSRSRADDEQREAERIARVEAEVRRKAEARPENVARASANSAPAIVGGVLLILVLALGAFFYGRKGVDDEATKLEAVQAAAEAKLKEEAARRAKAEALAREEVEKRSKLEIEAARRDAEQKAQAEAAAKARAEDEAKKAAEEKAKALALKKGDEDRKKAEAMAKKEAEAKAVAEAAAKKDAESKASLDAMAKKEAEAKALAEAEAKRKAEEQAKADAAKKAELARRAVPRAGSTFRDCGDCPEMVVIPAGSFVMGSPSSEEGRNSDEGPQHQVSIPRPLAVGKYEVTFDEWDACVRESGCSHRPNDFGWGHGRRPVIDVSWHDAKQYAEWLTRKTGKRYRLPTEAEWEYVARAGTTTPFSTGVTIGTSQANYGDSRDRTTPVGSYGANAFGLFDIHGNVWEWTQDCWNENYNGAPSSGSAWLSGDCSRRVVRGGSWYALPFFVRSAVRGGSFDDQPHSVRSALRHGDVSGVRLRFFGFRVARTLE